jgi:hypothetical protein
MEKSSKHKQSEIKIISTILFAVILFIVYNINQANLNNSILLTEKTIHDSGLNVTVLPRAPHKWVDEIPWKSTGYKERIEVDSIEDLINYASEVGVKTVHRNGLDFYVFCSNRSPRMYHIQIYTP